MSMSLPEGLRIYHVLGVLTILYVVVSRTRTFLRRRAFKEKHGCLPVQAKYPHRDPFGIDLAIANIRANKENRTCQSRLERFRAIGSTYEQKVAGQPFFQTNEPENMKAMLATQFADFDISHRGIPFSAIFGRGIFTNDGEDWSHSRSMIRPNFVKDQVADLQLFEDHIQELFKHIPTDGSTVDLQELFFCLTMDTATEFLLGESVRSLDHVGKTEEPFSKAFSIAQSDALDRSMMGFLSHFKFSSTTNNAIKYLNTYVDQFVEKTLRWYHETSEAEKSSGRYIFAQELVTRTQDRTRLRDELINVLLAGRDTTAGTLSIWFHVLARRPDIWERLQADISKLDGKIPTYEQVKNMKYLRSCLNETLRLYPVVPVNSRRAQRDTTLPRGGGPDGNSRLFVPKGTIVAWNVYALHRRTEAFGEDAEEFKPDRWDHIRPSWEYLPFNGGPRICLGQQFALMEASYVTIRMLQQYKNLEARDEQPWSENMTLTLSNGNGTKVALTLA